MNRKTSFLLSLGISTALIAVAIWLLCGHNADLWVGSGRWWMGYKHMMESGMGMVMIAFWIFIVGALCLLISGIINLFHRPMNRDDDRQDAIKNLKRRYASAETAKTEFDE